MRSRPATTVHGDEPTKRLGDILVKRSMEALEDGADNSGAWPGSCLKRRRTPIFTSGDAEDVSKDDGPQRTRRPVASAPSWLSIARGRKHITHTVSVSEEDQEEMVVPSSLRSSLSLSPLPGFPVGLAIPPTDLL
jgi:hypothetical protein